MPVYHLPLNSVTFPPSEFAEDDGLLAVGGDLNPGRLLRAYTNGIFPWYNPGEPILWWCPKERFLIFPKKIHISRSMKKFMKNTQLKTTINADFDSVIHNCRILREGETWITNEMEAAYKNLHRLGYALSVEVYDDQTLAGGLYGVIIGKCFFGESMFSKRTNASKLALIRLCKELEDFMFIDCQFHTEHLEKMGGEFVSWEVYKGLLEKGI